MSKLEVKEIGAISGETEVKVSDPLVTDSIMPTFIRKRTSTNNPDGAGSEVNENGGLNLLSGSLILSGGNAGSEGGGFNTFQVVHNESNALTRLGCYPTGEGYIDHSNGQLYLGTATAHPLYILTNGSARQTYSADGTISRVVDGQAREMLDAQDMVDLLKGIKDAVNSQTTVEGMRSSIESISDTLISKYEDKVKEFVEPEHPEGHGENL